MAKSIHLINPEMTYRDAPLPYLYLVLKSYYHEFGKYKDDWKWNLPISNIEGLEFDEIIELITGGNPTVVGFSCYIWNYKLNLELGKAIKEKLPNTIIAYGGPHILYHDNQEWFAQNPWCDIIGSGRGEEFFMDILDQLSEGHFTPALISSCVYPSPDKKNWLSSNIKPASFQWPRSMFYGSEVEIQLLHHMAKQRGARLSTLWETTRGCPYNCSYCDWGGATASKVLRKSEETVYAELKTMEELDICYIDVCDANFGILKKRDVDIIEHLIKRADEGWEVTVGLNGKAKNDLETVHKIDYMMMKSKIAVISDYHYSVNAADPKIAAAVNRSSFPSSRHTDFIKSINHLGYKTRIEYILGLPESTLETFYAEFNDISDSEAWLSERYVWTLLPRSPASKPEYVEKYKLKTVPVRYIHYNTLKQKLRDEYYLLDDPQFQGRFDIVIETSTYTKNEWLEMYFMDNFARATEPAKITTALRKKLEKENISAGEFFRACWRALQNMDENGQKTLSSIFESIEKALKGDTYFAFYTFKNQPEPLGLQTISMLLLTEHHQSFLSALTQEIPQIKKYTDELSKISESLAQIGLTKNPIDTILTNHRAYVVNGEL